MCLKSRKSDCYLPYSAVKPFDFSFPVEGGYGKERADEGINKRKREGTDGCQAGERQKKTAKKGEEKFFNHKVSHALSFCLF